MRLSTLVALLPGSRNHGDVEIRSVSINTRTLQPGDIFIAIAGENHDGHDFIKQAEQQGAIGLIISKPIKTELPYVIVTDTRQALGVLATEHRKKFAIPIIALTGSSGKTTVKNMIASILQQLGNTLATQGNYNNDIGTPLTLLRLTAEHEYAVIELGANHVGEIAYTVQLVKPDVALITNVAPAHLEGFGSIENIAAAKAEIYSGLTKSGTAIVNVDDKFADFWLSHIQNKTVMRFGLNHDSEVTATFSHMHDHVYPVFILRTPKGEIEITCPLPGRHQLYNVMAAAAATEAVGASLPQIKTGIEAVQQTAGRLRILQSSHGRTIVDDAYNANPGSVAVAIDTLVQFPGQHILVLGDLAELGPTAAEHMKQIGSYAKQRGIHQLYCCGQLSVHASESFGHGAQHFSDQQKLINYLKTQCPTEAVILIKGSRSAAMENVVKALVD